MPPGGMRLLMTARPTQAQQAMAKKRKKSATAKNQGQGKYDHYANGLWLALVSIR